MRGMELRACLCGAVGQELCQELDGKPAAVCVPRSRPPSSYRLPACLPAQDAQRKELDLRAPVNKQRAKKFDLQEELAVSVAAARCARSGPPNTTACRVLRRFRLLCRMSVPWPDGGIAMFSAPPPCPTSSAATCLRPQIGLVRQPGQRARAFSADALHSRFSAL